MLNMIYNICQIISILLLMASIVWMISNSRGSKIATPFIICQVSVLTWITSMHLEMGAKTVEQQLFYTNLGYLGVTFVGVAFFIFSLFFIRSKLANNKFMLTLFVIPSAIMYIIILTDPLHHFFFSKYNLSEIVPNWAYYVNLIISYTYVVLGLINLIVKSIRTYKKKKMQMWLISAVGLVPLLFHILSELRTAQDTQFDFTAISFAVSSVLILVAVQKFEFVTITPMAANQMMNNMDELIVIVNSDNIIKYTNTSFIKEMQFDSDSSDYTLDELAEFLKGKADAKSHRALENILSEQVENEEVLLNDKTFNMKKLLVRNKGSVWGSIITFTDMSLQYNLISQVKESNEKLTHANRELVKLNIISEKLSIEKERTRISQQLHDDLGHDMVSLMTLIKLYMIERQEDDEKLEQSFELSNNLLNKIRKVVSGISDNKLLTIEKRLQELKSKMTNTEIDINISIIGTEDDKYLFANEAIFCTVREAVTNAIKHGDADRIDVVVNYKDDFTKLDIIDNGKGCQNIIKNMGLKGIENNIIAIGGKVKFISDDESGFRVIAFIPIAEEEG